MIPEHSRTILGNRDRDSSLASRDLPFAMPATRDSCELDNWATPTIGRRSQMVQAPRSSFAIGSGQLRAPHCTRVPDHAVTMHCTRALLNFGVTPGTLSLPPPLAARHLSMASCMVFTVNHRRVLQLPCVVRPDSSGNRDREPDRSISHRDFVVNLPFHFPFHFSSLRVLFHWLVMCITLLTTAVWTI